MRTTPHILLITVPIDQHAKHIAGADAAAYQPGTAMLARGGAVAIGHAERMSWWLTRLRWRSFQRMLIRERSWCVTDSTTDCSCTHGGRTEGCLGIGFCWVASEIMKRAAHQGIRRDLFHYRDAAGLEVDLVSANASSVTLIEAKSGATIGSDFTQAVDRLAQGVRERSNERTIASRVIFGGTARQTRGDTQLLPWHEIDQLTWTDG